MRLLLERDPVGRVERLARSAGGRPGPGPTTGLLLGVLMLDPVTQQDLRDRVARDRALVEPEAGPFGVQDDLLVLILLERVVVPELLEDPAVARRPGLDRVDAKERPVPTPHPGESEFHCHRVPFVDCL